MQCLRSRPTGDRMKQPMQSLSIFFFFLLLFCCSSSSSVSASTVVTHLPGFQGPLPFYLETGYVNVDEDKGTELFYYFTRSERNPGEDPLMFWFSGGPGCTAINGLLFEMGPFEMVKAEYNGSLPSLKYRPLTWTKFANIIYVDCPAGAGFSYSKLDGGLGDMSTSYQIHNFIVKWFKDHPQFISNALYIAGDSYAGKFVPIITYLVAQAIEAGREPIFNLKGYIMGNPFTGERVDINSRVPFAHGMAMISDELAKSILRSCRGENYADPQTALCQKELEIFSTFTDEVDDHYILDPKCPTDPPFGTTDENIRSLKESSTRQIFDPPSFPDFKCRNYVYYLSYYWANHEATRKALGVKKGTVKEWVRYRRNIVYDMDVPSNIKYQYHLTSRGYRALIYSGDHDLEVPYVGTNQWTRSLNFSVVDEWRSWHVGDQVAGYTVSYSYNLSFATVKGAGHTAPKYKSEECFYMFGRWISHRPL